MTPWPAHVEAAGPRPTSALDGVVEGAVLGVLPATMKESNEMDDASSSPE